MPIFRAKRIAESRENPAYAPKPVPGYPGMFTLLSPYPALEGDRGLRVVDQMQTRPPKQRRG
jgi:hypothetical protein